MAVVVGPAGTGKTTMLAAAADDLARRGRPVFGVTPTAKAAHVLAREAGLSADTVAKLLHEWHDDAGAPDPRYRLPSGTTLIVDEAGMVGTSSLRELVELADRERWRLVLVGDPRQLQAVGRGGMFAELCRTSRTLEQARIHRFTHAWEADACCCAMGRRLRSTPTSTTAVSVPARSTPMWPPSPNAGWR